MTSDEQLQSKQCNLHIASKSLLSKFSYLTGTAIYVFWMDLRTNSDYFPIQHYLSGFYNRDEVFTAQYGLNL